MPKKLKAGFIGCGHIAGRHAEVLKTIGGAEITAISDLNEKNAQALIKTYGLKAKVWDSPEDLAKEADIDVLYILTPPFARGTIEKIAVERRLPMFIEKPVSPTLKQAKAIAKMIPDELIVSVAYNWRYLPHIPKMQKLLTQHTPVFFDAAWREQQPDAEWWFQRMLSGGPLVDQASHLLDLGLYLLGPVKNVRAIGRAILDVPYKSDVYDTTLGQMEFENGTLGRLLHINVVNQLHHTIGVDIICPGIEMKCDRVGNLDIIRKSGMKSYPGQADKLMCCPSSYELENKIFLQAVRTGDSSNIRCSFKDALQALALAEALYKAIDTGRQVPVANV